MLSLSLLLLLVKAGTHFILPNKYSSSTSMQLKKGIVKK